MKQTIQRILSLILALTMIMTMAPVTYATDDEANTYSDMAVSEEMASQLVEEMFGDTIGEVVETENGFQYMVSADALAGLTEQLEVQEVNDAASNELPEGYVDNSNEHLYELLNAMQNAPTLMSSSSSKTKVEIVFIIDSTGSMGGEISAVKNNVSDFATYLAEKDISLRLGLIDFRDITADGNSSTVVHSANHSNWMNVTQFISALTNVSASGGGDADETPIDALGHLTEGTISWSSDAYKFAVLITDVGYKTNNNHGISSMNDMIQRLSAADIQVSTITPSGSYETYGNLAGLTGGIQANLSSDFSKVLRDYADAVIGGAQATQDYTVRISEKTTGLPIKGAVISWNGGSAKPTDANGLTVVTTRNNPIRNVLIECAGYLPLELSSLELMKRGCINIQLTVSEHEEETPADGVPVLKKSDFQNPKDAEVAFAGPTLTLLGKDFNLFDNMKLGVNIDLFGSNVNIKHDAEKKEYKVIIAKEFEGKGEENSGYWEDSYQQYKALVQKFSDASAKDIYNQFRSLRKSAKSKADFVFPVDVQIGGYATVSYASGMLYGGAGAFGSPDHPPLLEGGVLIGISTKDIDLVNAPLPPAPYIYFKVTFKLEGKAEFALITVESTGKTKIGGSTTLSVEPSLKGTVNLGVDKLASVGGGLQGSLDAQIKIPFDNIYDAAEVTLNGSFIFELKLLGFNTDKTFPFAKLNIFPGSKARTAETLAVVGADDFNLISRPSTDQVMLLADDSDYTYYKANVYSDSAPQLVQLTDGSWLLVWLDAAPERCDNDMSALYYSYSADGETWSAAQMVSDDGTGDFMPALALAGDGTPVLAWQNSNQSYSGMELDLETRAKGIEVAVAMFDAVTGTFSETVSLTAENETCEMAVHVAAQGSGVAVYWLENSENSLLLASGTNQICTSSWNAEIGTWNDSAVVVSELGNLNNFTAGDVSGDAYVVYTLESNEYVNYYNLTDAVSGSIAVTGQAVDAQIGDGLLYWSDESGLYSWNGTENNLESEMLAGASFTMVFGDTHDVAMFAGVNDGANEIHASINNGSGWSNPVSVTDYGMILSSVSAAVDGDTLRWTVGRTVYDAESDTYGASDLVVDSYNFGPDIVVSTEAFVSILADTSADSIEVSVDLANKGLGDSGALKAMFYRGGEYVGEGTLYEVDESNPSAAATELTSIRAGEIVWAVTDYTLPEDRVEHELEIQITDLSGETVYGSAYVIIPGAAPDLIVENVAVARTEGGAIVTATVRNVGTVPADDVIATLTQEGQDGSSSMDLNTLAAGDSEDVSFTVSEDKLSAASIYDYKRFTVSVSTSTEEYMLGDNSDDALLAPVAVTEIVMISAENPSVEVDGTVVFDYQILPESAPEQTVTWMSSDVSILTVENGVVTGHKPGSATVTVLTCDNEGNQITDSVIVTVEGEVEISVSGIEIVSDTSEMYVGDTTEFSARVLPENATNQKFTWETTTPGLVNLAASEDGKTVTIEALAEGTAVIVARTDDGDYSASVQITILGSHRHSYSAVVTIPTCTEQGYTTYVCDCGDSYVSNYVESLGHNVVLKDSSVPTCDLNGYEYYACERCGGQEYTIILESTGHSYMDGKCEYCGEADPNAKPSKPGWNSWLEKLFGFWWGNQEKCKHTYNSVTTDPTCTEKGYTTHTCSKCGDCYKDSYVNAIGHNYVDGSCIHCGKTENTKPGFGGWFDWIWPFW